MRRRWALAGGVLILAGAAGATIALAGGALGAGCVDPTTSGATCDGGPFDTIDAFCGALAAADCSPAILKACQIADVRSCIAAVSARCVQASSRASPCDPTGPLYTAEFVCDCIDAHTSVYAAASLTTADFLTLSSACLAVVNGGCLEGATCTSDTDCDVNGGLVCVTQSAATGTCEVPSAAVAGDPCTDPTAQCNNNTFCADGGKCVADLKVCTAASHKDCPRCSDVSAPCFSVAIVDASVGPAGESFGVNGARCVGGVCEAKLPDGAHCAADGDCVGGFCVSGTCERVYVFGKGTPPTETAPGCAYFEPLLDGGPTDGG